MTLVKKLRADYEMLKQVGKELSKPSFLYRFSIVLLIPILLMFVVHLFLWSPYLEFLFATPHVGCHRSKCPILVRVLPYGGAMAPKPSDGYMAQVRGAKAGSCQAWPRHWAHTARSRGARCWP
jgi:hypothetical protein